MMHHYHLSTHHVFQMPRSDVRSETLAALQSIIEVATGGQAVPLPGFPEYFLRYCQIELVTDRMVQ